MWQMSAIYPGKAAANSHTKLVVSPRGSFSTWAMNHGSWFKAPFWSLFQRAALVPASCFHATAAAEYADIRRLGFKQPVAIISNGIDVPERFHKEPGNLRTLLFLGRIHPKKGVDILLRAWAEVQDRYKRWRLLVVGTDKGYGGRAGYLDEMKQIAATLRLKQVEFSDALYGEAKWTAYRRAELFVLPTHSENFGMTVAEALASGTPVIVSKGAPWREIESRGAGWWIDIGVEALVAALEQAMAESFDSLAQRGLKGREWMTREFSWSTVGTRMDETYRWLMNGGKPPAWVKID
jgi:glycosyltransferase involved in cell wall biosynthesis